MIGIYKIENKINNFIYIGQSNDIERRWKEHIYELNNNKHNNFHLQNAWNKYGCDNFKFEKIDECNIQELNEKEMFWISYYKSNIRGYGYNVSAGGNSFFKGMSHSDDTKSKMSKLRNPEKIVQIDFNGNLLNIWRSASHVSRTLNISANSIIRCAENKDCVTVGGYIWIYEKDYDKNTFDINKYKLQHTKSFDLKIFQYDLYGNLIYIWNNYDEIKSSTQYLTSMIGECCNRKRQTYKNFIWMYEIDKYDLSDDFLRKCRIDTSTYKIKQYDLNMNFLKLWTIDEIINNGYLLSSIRQCCRGKAKTFKNFIWKYE